MVDRKDEVNSMPCAICGRSDIALTTCYKCGRQVCLEHATWDIDFERDLIERICIVCKANEIWKSLNPSAPIREREEISDWEMSRPSYIKGEFLGD